MVRVVVVFDLAYLLCVLFVFLVCLVTPNKWVKFVANVKWGFGFVSLIRIIVYIP